MATFDFAVQVDVRFWLSQEKTSTSPSLTKVYRPGQKFPAVFLPAVGDHLEVTSGFCTEVISRTVGTDYVLVGTCGGPLSDAPMWDQGLKTNRSLQQAIVDSLRAVGFR